MSLIRSTNQHRILPGPLRRSGGLQWHFRALRNYRLHRPFRESISEFLDAWDPGGSQLILIGPSAGWFLPKSFLCRFVRLTLIDLDTSAPIFFALRHGRSLRRSGTQTSWIHADFIDNLPQVLATDPNSAVLFCNVLGQLGLEREDYETQLCQLPKLLGGRRWASFHDRFSTQLAVGGPVDTVAFTSRENMDARMLRGRGFFGEWTDHGTGAVLPSGVLRHYLPWRIVPDRFHWIEAGVGQ